MKAAEEQKQMEEEEEKRKAAEKRREEKRQEKEVRCISYFMEVQREADRHELEYRKQSSPSSK